MKKYKYRPYIVYPPCPKHPERWSDGIYQPAHAEKKEEKIGKLIGVIEVIILFVVFMMVIIATS